MEETPWPQPQPTGQPSLCPACARPRGSALCSDWLFGRGGAEPDSQAGLRLAAWARAEQRVGLPVPTPFSAGSRRRRERLFLSATAPSEAADRVAPAARPSAADSGERGAACRRRAPLRSAAASCCRRVLHFVIAAWSARQPRGAGGAAIQRRHFAAGGAAGFLFPPCRRGGSAGRHPAPRPPPSLGTRPPLAPALAVAETPPTAGRRTPPPAVQGRRGEGRRSEAGAAATPAAAAGGRRAGPGPAAPRRQEAKRPVPPGCPRAAPPRPPRAPPAPLGARAPAGGGSRARSASPLVTAPYVPPLVQTRLDPLSFVLSPLVLARASTFLQPSLARLVARGALDKGPQAGWGRRVLLQAAGRQYVSMFT